MRGLLTLAVLAACGHAAAPPPAPEAPAPPALAVLPFDVVATGQDSMAFTADATHLWWMNRDGTLYRAAHDGSGAVLLATVATTDPGTLLVVGDTIFGATGDLWMLEPHDRAPRILVHDVETYADGVVVIGDTIYFDHDQEIDTVTRAGGAPVKLVDHADAGKVAWMVTDGTYLYWTDEGDKVNGVQGSVRRLRLGGGHAVEIFAADQGEPEGLAIVGDRLFWSDSTAAVIVSAPLAGGPPVVEMPGPGGYLIAGDELGIVAFTDTALFERPTGGPLAVRSLDVSETDQLALTEDGIFLADSFRGKILRYPRGGTALTVLASSAQQIVSAAAVDDRLDYLELGPPRLMSVPELGGPARELGMLEGDPTEIVAGDGQVAVIDQSGAIRVLGGVTADAGGETNAAAIDRGRLLWLRGSELYAEPLAGGRPRLVDKVDAGDDWSCAHAPDDTDSRGCQLQGWIERFGDDLVIGGGTLGAVVRLDATGAATVLSGEADGFAIAGDQIAILSSGGELTLRPSGRDLLDAGDAQLIGGDRDGVWITRGNDEARITEHLRLGGGAPDRRIPGLTASQVVPLDDAVCFVTSDGHLLLRLAR